MKKILILFSIFYFLLSGYIFAQETKPFSIPRSALSGPPLSIIPTIRFFGGAEPPATLNLMSKKSIIAFKNRFNQIKELRAFALQSPLSFFRLQQDSIIVFSILKGLSPIQVLNMSIFCGDKAVYVGLFANQVMVKLGGNFSDNLRCSAIVEYEDKKGSGNIQTLKTEITLPKFR